MIDRIVFAIVILCLTWDAELNRFQWAILFALLSCVSSLFSIVEILAKLQP
jgi:ABC-type multidrug transport system permease subunit